MPDETTEFIIADSAVDALAPRKRRRWFRGPAVERSLTKCENCETPLVGPYCAQCGQHAIDYRRSLMQVMIDAADSFFDWDTKFLRSLGILLLRPGRLTNDFNAGRRVRYMHPLRLYFLASIAFFLLAKLINLTPSESSPLNAEDRIEIDNALAQLTSPDSPLSPEQRAKVDAVRNRFAARDSLTKPVDRERLDRLASRFSRFVDKEKLKPKDLVKLDAILSQAQEAGASPSPAETLVGQPDPQASPSASPSPTRRPGLSIQYDDNQGRERVWEMDREAR